MADIVSPEVRSRMMAGIRGKDTKPELTVRRALHARGFRYRLHTSDIPGKPDLVLPKFAAVVFIHGCFWHGHECHLFHWPRTREEFWREKIRRNQANDRANAKRLTASGWRQAVVWECALKGRMKIPVELLTDQLADWIHSVQASIEIEGKSDKVWPGA